MADNIIDIYKNELAKLPRIKETLKNELSAIENDSSESIKQIAKHQTYQSLIKGEILKAAVEDLEEAYEKNEELTLENNELKKKVGPLDEKSLIRNKEAVKLNINVRNEKMRANVLNKIKRNNNT